MSRRCEVAQGKLTLPPKSLAQGCVLSFMALRRSIFHHLIAFPALRHPTPSRARILTSLGPSGQTAPFLQPSSNDSFSSGAGSTLSVVLHDAG